MSALALALCIASAPAASAQAPAPGDEAGRAAEMLVSRSRLHERLGELSEAIRLLEQAIPRMRADAPKTLAARLRLAGLHARSGRHEKAMEIYDACRANPLFSRELGDRKPWHETLVRTGRAGEEIERLRPEVEAAADRLATLYELVDLLGAASRRTEAVELLRAAAARRPLDIHLRLRLADLLAGSGRAEEAVIPLREAAAITPDDPGVIRRLGLALVAAGRSGEARAALRALLRDPADPAQYTACAEQYQALAMPDEAIALLLEARERFPHPMLFLVELGRAYEVALRFPEAAGWYCRAIEAGRDHEGREALREMVRTEPAAYDPAMAALAARLSSEEPGRSRAFLTLLLEFALDFGRFPDALDFAGRLADGGDAEALFRFARVARAAGEEEMRRAALDRLASRHATHPVALLARMELANAGGPALGREDRSTLERLVREGGLSERRAAAYTLYREAERALDAPRALEALDAHLAAAMFPPDVALAGLVRVALDLGRADLARRLVDDPARAGGRSDLAEGMTLLHEGSVEAALARMEEAVMRAPLAGGAAEAVDLAFLGRLAEPAALAAWLALRADLYRGSGEARLLRPLAEGTGEAALRAALDAARLLDARGESAEALLYLDLAARSGGTGADAAAFERLERLMRAGDRAAFLEAARRFPAAYPTSPRFKDVKEALARYEKNHVR